MLRFFSPIFQACQGVKLVNVRVDFVLFICNTQSIRCSLLYVRGEKNELSNIILIESR